MSVAMILAAGQGLRMRPLTEKIPKPLVKVAGKPLLQQQIERLRDLGCTRVVINYAHLGSMIRDYFACGDQFGVDIKYSDEGATPIGTAAGVKKALPLLASDAFYLVSSDALCDYDKLPPPGADELATVLMVENPEHNKQGDFFLQNGKLSLHQGERLTYSGIGYYRREFFQSTDAAIVATSLGELLRQAVDQGKVAASKHPGYWIDVGTEERLRQAEQLIQNS